MKLRITNVLTATLWLLIIAVWLPTFWALAQLPGTWDGHSSSVLLRYVEFELDTVDYRIHDPNKFRDCDPNLSSKPAESKDKKQSKYSYLYDPNYKPPCGKPLKKTLSTGISDWFIPLAIFTLLVLVGQYLLTGRLTLRFTKEKEDTQT